MDDVIQTKRCSKCGRILPLSDFYRDKQTKDGLFCWCKACIKAKNAQHYQSNKDAIAQKAAEYRANNKEAIAQKKAQYYQENKEAIAQKAAEYRANNKEAIAQKKAQYYQENKEAIAQKAAEYRANNKEAIAQKAAEYRDPIINPLGWARKIVGNYRYMDRERGFDTSKTVTAEWFVQNIMYKPCAHCGLLQAGAIGANRLNNDLGHEASNLEPCCMPCNERENIRDQIARGLHWTCKHKKQSFKDFVNEHKAKDKNLS